MYTFSPVRTKGMKAAFVYCCNVKRQASRQLLEARIVSVSRGNEECMRNGCFIIYIVHYLAQPWTLLQSHIQIEHKLCVRCRAMICSYNVYHAMHYICIGVVMVQPRCVEIFVINVGYILNFSCCVHIAWMCTVQAMCVRTVSLVSLRLCASALH